MATLLEYRLRQQGFGVEVAQDGATGLELARQQRPDLVVLDLNLPELPGEEVCKAIREDDDETFAGTPIIMVTAKHGDVDRIIGKSLGANRYVTKPFDLESLIEEIRQLLNPAGGSSSAGHE